MVALADLHHQRDLKRFVTQIRSRISPASMMSDFRETQP
jgi:hypothetical protein